VSRTKLLRTHDAISPDPRAVAVHARVAQWFSQGCAIGCPTCTGIGSHTNESLCPSPTATATLPTHAWTMNRGVTPGSANDSYRFNPWRAPGAAPVNDPWCDSPRGRRSLLSLVPILLTAGC
jgi:hypothetical protein